MVPPLWGWKVTKSSWCPQNSAHQGCDWNTFRRQCAFGEQWNNRLGSRSQTSFLKGQRPRPRVFNGKGSYRSRGNWHIIMIFLGKQSKHVHIKTGMGLLSFILSHEPTSIEVGSLERTPTLSSLQVYPTCFTVLKIIRGVPRETQTRKVNVVRI